MVRPSYASRITPGKLVKGRQDYTCWKCRRGIPKGTYHFRETTMPFVRPDRLCQDCATTAGRVIVTT